MKKLNQVIFALFFSAVLFASFPQSLSCKPYGGEYKTRSDLKSCLSAEHRARIIQSNKEIISTLKLQSNLHNTTSENLFIWPMRNHPDLDYYGFYAVYNFVDHDPDYPDKLLDYFGGSRSYDRENGYNHQGTDISPWPFAWYLMDNDLVEIISMAPGTIIGKQDGNFDRNCGFNESDWNAIYIMHYNGIIAWYGHLKNGSLTSKSIGDSVEAGEYLGVVGSSGSSFSPHLHLELYDSDYKLIDAWEGPFNSTITTSLWQNQPQYYDSKINLIATHSGWPVFPECPEQEVMNLRDEFESGDTVYLITYYQDQLEGQVSEFKVYTPDNSVWTEWDHSIEDDYYTASYWGWWLILPDGAPEGEWRFTVNYESVNYEHEFMVYTTTGTERNEAPVEFFLAQNYPNPFNPSTKIRFSIPEESFVQINVYDVLGRLVMDVINEKHNAGVHEISVNFEKLPSGVYYYKMKAGAFIETKKMLVIK